MNEITTNEYWRLETYDDNIVWLHFDTPGSATNVLKWDALDELQVKLKEVVQKHPRGLVILSDKASGFIVGADVHSFAQIESREQAEQALSRVHKLFFRLESLGFPTVALIHGFCLGGGLELSLACKYRIARNDDGTRLGFPEVRLGIFPGFGGSVRSVRRIGPIKALDLMLSGRTVSGRAAQHMKLVDLAVPQRQLKAAARYIIHKQPPQQKPGWLDQLANSAPLRPALAWYLRRQVAKKARPEHYPAPYALLAHWQHHASHPREMYNNEVKQVADLIMGRTAQNLVRVFQLQERLKAQGKQSDFKAQHVHVIGGGIMGGDIAAWCAFKGYRVSLQDQTARQLGAAVKRAHTLFKRKLKKPRLIQAAMDRLMPDVEGHGLKRADVVIEAIFEDLKVKQKLFAEIEKQAPADALLASNTSSIPLQQIAENLQNPQRLVGLHFFNPVAQMLLVEIVSSEQTDADAAQKAARFAKDIGKLPLPVRSSPGFLVNRILMPYLLEAVNLLDEGVPAAAIDEAALQFGMPMGPVELSDVVGLDICLSVAEKLSGFLAIEVPENLQKKVQFKQLGKKSGHGFYRWEKGKAQKEAIDKDYTPPLDIAERLVFRMFNECVACLRESVVEDADLLDAGIIFGTGFAPFRGGPMHYIKSQGVSDMQHKLENLQQQHGEQFTTDKGWNALS